MRLQEMLKQQEVIGKKWVAALPDHINNTSGNVTIGFDHTGNAVLCDYMTGIPDSLRSLAITLPPKNLFYFIACLLKCTAYYTGSDFDKVCGSIPLTHVATGEILHLYDWKGYVSFGTKHMALKTLPKAFADDLCELFTLLASGKMLHPYTGRPI